MRIAICDDNISDLTNIVSIVTDYIYAKRNQLEIEYVTFQNAMDLIMLIEKGQRFDLLLLDILMPYISGMDAAKEIRQYDQNVKIIFSTSSPEFAVDSYVVDAFYYAIKPIWKEKLTILLDKVISEITYETGTSFLIKSKNGLTRIHTNRLEYAEVIGRTIYYHLSDHSVLEAAGSMLELEEELLENSCFIKPHRSYIINIDFIDTLSPREIKMRSGAILPMAKANYKIVKSAYIEFTFRESISKKLVDVQ